MMKCFLYVFLMLATPAFSQKQVRVACVGNSITFGAGIENRARDSYPAQLQTMLGSAYHIMNFGSNGATLLKNGNNPYWKTQACRQALESAPDIVIIKLGTNDSKRVNRSFYGEFVNDYKALIRSFAELPSHPRILLLLPVPSFVEDSNAIYDPVIEKQITPMIRQAALDTHTELIYLRPLFIEKRQLFPDRIHPNVEGARIIAQRVYEAIRTPQPDPEFDLFRNLKRQLGTAFDTTGQALSSFYGFECVSFRYAGRPCKVVRPKVTAGNRPWVWRARFWGHEPQTDIFLLERGFHIVYCDVAELFGNAEAIAAWNRFYKLLQTGGLAKRAVMEGMSRGGVYVYNWALSNPGKIAGVYADAPVLDLKSWPGGKGAGPGDKASWEIFKQDYKLSDAQADQFVNSPLDHAGKIARLGFPMLHVVGDADEVVPVAENTTPFEQRIKKAGGKIKVIHKAGVGHHPHSLTDPTPIVDFILDAVHFPRP
ncbi:GDSL-type esterase/lipase family protein [Niabella drilacis]|uniref:Lysophospholipase L1 n=1 Tax=Niabella drilacis (strain DSM 25811 / CCM 8410 / CCUG 62505 / LMG 26954 / E90) TaxID=1285928 RepID=A0A1G6Y0E6_NIADE|nr:GDSL-type esterase/lipase family protein [Niabella drilacis]SDD83423.1 Lysophospholipase L1 [Niabella drilacis]